MYVKKRDGMKHMPMIMMGTLAALLFIGVVAVLEQGPPSVRIFTGSSPLNTGPLGTSDFYMKIKEIYPRTLIVTNWLDHIKLSNCDKAVLVVISPEEVYSDKEIYNIKDLASKCGSFNIFIADETANSSALLRAFNSSIEITGSIILEKPEPGDLRGYKVSLGNTSAVVFPVESLIYPKALFDLKLLEAGGNSSYYKSYNVTLDIASFITYNRESDHNITVIGYIPSGLIVNSSIISPEYYVVQEYSTSGREYYSLLRIINPSSSLAQYSQSKTQFEIENISSLPLIYFAPVGVIEETRGSRILVVSDGSIFLNQVFRSDYRDLYLNLSLDLIRYLCENDERCVILFDSSKYLGLEPLEAIKDPSLVRLVPLYQLIAFFLARILHPATWLPPVISWFNNFILDLLRTFFVRPMLILLLVLIFSIPWLRREEMYRDKPFREVDYKDILQFSELVERIKRGRHRFGRDDFIELYNFINNLMKSYVNMDLLDPVLPSHISSRFGIDQERVRMYQEFMNKYYRIATRKGLGSFLKPFWWSRIVKKAALESYKLIKDMGEGLEKKISEV
ncbi:MAG: hypothetical protein QXS45_00510 [Sulfolobales archaeon]